MFVRGMLPKGNQKFDPATGCWDLNTSLHLSLLPKPLYIMGYGSLLWKPGPLLGKLKMVAVACPGYRRLFAQRSCDHRGTTSYPGLVLTLVDDEYIASNSSFSSSSPPSSFSSSLPSIQINSSTSPLVSLTSPIPSTHTSSSHSPDTSRCLAGIFEVSDDSMVLELLAYLDDREKGGYVPAVIDVELLQSSSFHESGTLVKALVYVGESDNPNFYFPKSLSEDCYLDRISNIISVATGPSGFNAEYLFKLANFLSLQGFHDLHLNELAYRVWNKISYVDLEGSTITHSRRNSRLTKVSLLGCGSNEFSQIDPFILSTVSPPLVSFCKKIAFIDSLYYMPLNGSRDSNNEDIDLLQIEQCFTGSSVSAVLLNVHTLILYGNLNSFPDIVVLLSSLSPNKICRDSPETSNQNMIAISDVLSCAIGFDHLSILFCNGQVLCLGDDSSGQCSAELSVANNSGYAHKKDEVNYISSNSNASFPVCRSKVHELKTTQVASLLSIDPSIQHLNIPVIKFGDILDSEPSTVSTVSTTEATAATQTTTCRLSMPQCKVAVGLRHTAALSADRRVLSLWGDNRKGQCGSCSNGSSINTGVCSSNISCGGNNSVNPDILSQETYEINRSVVVKQCRYEARTRDSNSDVNYQIRRYQHYEWSFADKDIKWMDVACGAYFTIAIDTLGRVWSVGDNSYGQLGRNVFADESVSIAKDINFNVGSNCLRARRAARSIDPTPYIVADLDYMNVKYDKVQCGKSHAVVHGITLAGESVFVAIGRSDMGQYPLSLLYLTSNADKAENRMHFPLKELPRPVSLHHHLSPSRDVDSMSEIAHVWCGSEFIYACDRRGYLFSSGWGEHGNLGSIDVNVAVAVGQQQGNLGSVLSAGDKHGLTNGCVFEWRPVLAENSSSSSSSSGSGSSCSSNDVSENCLLPIDPLQICLGESAGYRSVSCGGGHVLVQLG